MATDSAPTPTPSGNGASLRDHIEQIRKVGRSAATHAGNAAAYLRLAAAQREQTRQRR